MIMARRKNDQLGNANLVVNSTSQGMTTMGNAPHPDSGRQKGLSPKTTKDKNQQKFSKQQTAGGLSSSIGGLPLNLQQQHSGAYSKQNTGYLGSKMQNPKVMVTSHGSDILGSQFTGVRGSNQHPPGYGQGGHLSFKSGGPIRAFESGLYMGSRGGLGADFHGPSRKQTQA